MTAQERQALTRLLIAFKRRLGSQICLFQEIVFEYATADAIAEDDFSQEIVVHDYVFYCFTKACKSLMAVSLLLDNRLPEDAMILLRSVYESYLHIVYVLQNPDHIDDFVQKKIGIYTGRFKHPVSKKGNKMCNQVIDSETGEISTYGIGISTLVHGSKYQFDKEVHTVMFPFLSEHTHPNMIASGNYREDDIYYSYWQASNTLQSAFYAVYISTLILSEALVLEELVEAKEIKYQCRQSIKVCERFIALVECPNPFDSFPNKVQSRLAELVKHLSKRRYAYLKPYPKRKKYIIKELYRRSLYCWG
ncbi:hypothetical protein IQ244_04780 [Nostoc sp. LEGE 06077]|uniref:DUF5677 domain-containing protein n=1 Tax=Nostoc sp. LEGE 06077 TaxID=915325 RepID=UPI00187E518A|nr:DUF5677 domain-containing protein [Nostoc sp. LEGE 06077]MBE9205838.1 hypothetical protein [Nostoc sp. LEGE 06077]